MGIFRQFPYTNFHDMNLDWFLSHFDEFLKEWEEYKKKIDNKVNEVDEFIKFFNEWTSEKISDAVWEWLNDHPEAITMNWFVTPKMYGAVGDGTTNDTEAFEAAFNSGKQVIVTEGFYYLTDTIITDESVLYKDYGQYTNKQIVCSKNFTEGAVNAYNFKNEKLSDYNLRGVQGVCYNSDHNSIIYGSDINVEDNIPILVEVSLLNGTILQQTKNSQYGHINDITYNPKTRKYYMPYGDSNNIVIVDEFFSYETLKYITGVPGLITQISYDNNADVFFINTLSDGIYILDNELNVLKRVSNNNDPANDYPYEHIASTYPQGSTIYKGQFISIHWLWGNDGYPSYARLIQYNYVTGDVKQINDVVMEYGNEEPEGLYAIDDYIYMIGYYGDTLTTTKLDFNKNNFVSRNGKQTINFILGSTTHEGVQIRNLKMEGEDGFFFLSGWIDNNGEAITEGTSVAMYMEGISHMYGIAQGWTGGTFVEVIIENNNIAFRPINGNFPNGWNSFIRGFVKII